MDDSELDAQQLHNERRDKLDALKSALAEARREAEEARRERDEAREQQGVPCEHERVIDQMSRAHTEANADRASKQKRLDEDHATIARLRALIGEAAESYAHALSYAPEFGDTSKGAALLARLRAEAAK